MCAKTSKPTDDWAALLEDELKKEGKLPPGKGWLTQREIKAQWNIGYHKLYKMLRSLMAEGKVERFDGHTYTKGRVSTKTWYRVK